MSKMISSQLKQELLDKYSRTDEDKHICISCRSNADAEFERMIFWKHHAFCSGWCQYDYEHTARKLWVRLQNTKHKTIR